MCPVRACNRHCLNSSKERLLLSRRKAVVSIRSQEFVQLDTTNILFIVGGAFDGLDKVIVGRSEKGGIGFGAEVKSKDDVPKLGQILRDVRARRFD